MPPLRITERARGDLTKIVKHIAADSPGNATRFAIDILKKCQLIAAKPMLVGRSREDIHSGLRGSLYGNYVILYYAKNGTVDIMHIVHGARDIKRSFEN